MAPPYQLPPGQADDTHGVNLVEATSVTFLAPLDEVPGWRDYQTWKADGHTPDPAPPPPLVYSTVAHVEARLRTTDAAAHEILRFACDTQRVYQANLTISGVDAGSFASKIMEGRFTWKRVAAAPIMVGIVVVSDIHDAAAAAWAPNALPSGNDIVFTVAGAAGRTVDWLLVGTVGAFVPQGA